MKKKGHPRRFIDPAKGRSKRRPLSLYDCEVKAILSLTKQRTLTHAVRELLDFKKRTGWVSVDKELPEPLETVWISDGKGWTTLGCRGALYDDGNDGYTWCWAALCGGSVYEEDGAIVAECEEDDLDVRFWHRLPKTIKSK